MGDRRPPEAWRVEIAARWKELEEGQAGGLIGADVWADGTVELIRRRVVEAVGRLAALLASENSGTKAGRQGRPFEIVRPEGGRPQVVGKGKVQEVAEDVAVWLELLLDAAETIVSGHQVDRKTGMQRGTFKPARARGKLPTWVAGWIEVKPGAGSWLRSKFNEGQAWK